MKKDKLHSVYIVGALLAALVMVLAACGQSSEVAAPAEEPAETAAPPAEAVDEVAVGDSVLYGSIADASDLNPILYADAASETVVDRIFEGLVDVNDQIEFYGVLAEDWEFSDDGTQWRFYLRQGVTWQDGEPFTARDVAFTFESMLHPDYQGVRRGDYSQFAGYAEYTGSLREIDGELSAEDITEEAAREQKLAAFEEWRDGGAIQIIDDHTIQFTLTAPFAPFMPAISMKIIPGHVFSWDHSDAGNKSHPFNAERPVGTGPFKFVNWSRDEEIVLERNADYWGAGPYIERFVMRVIPDQQVVTLALETGEIDLGPIQPEDFSRLQEIQHLQTFEYPTFSYTFMGYNLTNPLFQDKRVRQALTHSIDREVVVDELLYGHGTVAHSHGSSARWDFNPNVPRYGYNPDTARDLLAEAGWSLSGDRLMNDGEAFEFKLETNQGNKIREDSAVLVQDQLKDLGIDVEVAFVEWNTFVNEVLLARDFDATIVGWSLTVDPDAYTIWHSAGGPFNFVTFENERIDELLELGRATLEQDDRRPIYHEFQAILAEEQPYTFLYFANSLQGLHERFQGPISGTPAGMLWNLTEWYVPANQQMR